MPFAFIDLDLLNINLHELLLRAGDKPVRIASKSIRSVAILKYLLSASPRLQGIMAYHPAEAAMLARAGFNDILVAYPCLHESYIIDICQLVRAGKDISLMADSPEHLVLLNRIAAHQQTILPICLDADMSSNYGLLHFGVHRSPINNLKKVDAFLNALASCSNLKLVGLMGYEAQIAGLGDNVPKQSLKNKLIRRLQNRSIPELTARRQAIVKRCTERGYPLRFVNGGGSGSLESTAADSSVTELTAGSLLYSPTLFDYYSHFRHLPAAGYAIEITRMPQRNIYTCSGGGYTASGTADATKAPQPYLPEGCQLLPNEGAGEVQTPIRYKGNIRLHLSDPIFMRYAKAGEFCERFNDILLVSKGAVLDKVPTYRGEGYCFM